jgi:hypothetical protein
MAALLRASMEAIRAESAALTDGVASWHPAPGEWCVKEVLGHIIEAERRGFARRVREFLAKEEPTCVPWDQDAMARERKTARGRWAPWWTSWVRCARTA